MQNENREQGITHIILLVLLVVVLGVVGFAGYKVYSKNNSKSKNSATSVSAVATASTNDACSKQLKDNDLCKFASQYNELSKTSYAMVMTSTNSNGSTTLKLSQDAKGNTEGSFDGGAGSVLNSDYITDSGYTYSKDLSSGVWTRFPDNSPAAPPTDNPLSGMKLFDGQNYNNNGNASFKKLGTEACGSVTCFKYQFTDKSMPGSQNYIWFDTKDYTLRRMQYQDPTGSIDLTISYENVKIIPPSTYTDYTAQQ